MIAPASQAEAEAFEIWKRLRPDAAFVAGIPETAGRFFIPTAANVKRVETQIARIRKSTKDAAVRKFLASLAADLVLPEPSRLPETMVASLFGYMIKEGVEAEHMRSLAIDGARALEANRRRFGGRRWPPGMRALIQLSASGLTEIVGIVEKELQLASGNGKALVAVASLKKALERYRKSFDLPGFRPEAPFPETYEFLKERGADLGRARTYPRALRDLWDYTQTPRQVESAGLRMMRRELPRFRALTVALAGDLHCDPTAEAVVHALRTKAGLRPDQILPFLTAVRDPCERVANKHVVAIDPAYTVLVIETPPYFVNTTPSGAAYEIDTLTDRAKQVFMATTDERSAARPPPGDLLSLLIHEEYGHCVHGSNSAHAFRGRPALLDVLGSSFECVSEGIAFQRELEFVPVINGIVSGRYDGPEEKAFAEALEAWGGLTAVARQYEFLTYTWRITRFLRVIGDARINSGKQDIIEFVDWAHEATGLEKATVYYNLFPAHQVLGAGYATTYATIGERIRKIQEEAAKRGIPLRELNAYASSIGWPPTSVFEAKVRAWVKDKSR
ncbi:MAG TPA: hypothetical protein VEY12_01620 [Thermoplasmata archaeon]|nr:hypothetical protein [Thermoplasmata archaeon]